MYIAVRRIERNNSKHMVFVAVQNRERFPVIRTPAQVCSRNSNITVYKAGGQF